MQNSVYKTKKITPWFVISTTIKCLLLAFVITIVVAFAFGFRLLNVVSASMTPTININDVVVMRPVRTQRSYNNIRIGDIVTFRSGTVNVTHRVIGFLESTGEIITAPEAVFILTGPQGIGTVNTIPNVITIQDENGNNVSQPIATDGTISPDRVVGVVMFHIPAMGNVLNFINNNMIAVIIIAVLFVLVIMFLF